MFEKLRQITKQYDELRGRLEQPETYNDPGPVLAKGGGKGRW